MKIAVIGAGAMGCLFGGLLSDVAEVCLYSRNAGYMDAIRKKGLIMTRGSETFIKTPRAVSDPVQIGPSDVVILFVKATGVRGAMEHAMRSSVTGDTVVIALQNGIGSVDIVREFVGDHQIAYGFSTLTSDMVEPGHIEMTTKSRVETCFAPLNGDVTPVLSHTVELMNRVGLHAAIPDNLDEKIWYKLMVNASQNTLCSLLRTTVHGLVSVPESLALQNQIVLEVAAVARAKGLSVSDDEALRHVAGVSAANPQHIPSMVFDMMRKKPTEIMSLNVAVVREGEALGVPTPINRLIAGLIVAAEKLYDTRVELD